MPCEWYETSDGGVMHINRGRSPGRRMKCKFCGCDYRESDGKLCDFPVEHGKTCDAAMCPTCAVTVGRQKTDVGAGLKRLNDTIDLCPIHRAKAVATGGKLEAL